jgi:hypothetical protein
MCKICIKCNILKEYDKFPLRKDSKDGYRNSCKECEYKKTKKWKEKNSDITKEYYKKYLLDKKEKLNNYKNNWFNEKMKSDSNFKLKKNIKNTIKGAFRGKPYKRNQKVIDILGCSIDEFKIYLESKFESWMTWNNHGLYEKNKFNVGWDIDHIIPISKASTKYDILKLSHYSNFQPLCSKINRDVKKAKYYGEDMSIQKL